MAKRICRFLSFFHDIPSQIFNVGDYRRQLHGATLPATFYDPDNTVGRTARDQACDAALSDLLSYLQKENGARVAAFDATNTTKARRQYILQKIQESNIGAKKMFVESICDDENVGIVSKLSSFVFRSAQLISFLSPFSKVTRREYTKSQDKHARLSVRR
jgi:6-phosphofructo-2-kinase / fructose-2,6-biphosphatase 2